MTRLPCDIPPPNTAFQQLSAPNSPPTSPCLETKQALPRQALPRPTERDQLATLPLDDNAPPPGRYHVLREHAQGGLGRVLVAKDHELERQVALKEIRPEYSHDANCRERFMREAEITGRLEHPGIVPVYSLGQYSDGSPYYAMRFIRGASLRDAIERFHELTIGDRSRRGASLHNLELRRLVQRLIDVCQTVDYAHSRGVLHRDIKPDNVMLGAFGETLVVDWGLAKAFGKSLSPDSAEARDSELPCLPPPSIVAPVADSADATRMGAIVGTLPFMSPEQALGRHDLMGPASDVFSLGASLYELLTGELPYRGKDVLRQAQQANYPLPRSVNRKVPRALEAICLKAMAAQISNRYASAGQLAQDLERYLADEPIVARPDRGLDHVLRFARRHRAWVQAGVLAMGIVAVVATLAAMSIHGSLRRAERAEQSAVTNLELAETARKEEAARAEAEAQQRRRAESAEAMARLSAAQATAERDRAEREKRIVEMIVAEHAPSLLRLPGEYFADRQSLADFATALATVRQSNADGEADARNREAVATFARLLAATRVFRDDVPQNLASDRYLLEKVVIPALSIPPPPSASPDDQKHLALLWAAKGRLVERNPSAPFLAAAGIQIEDDADEYTLAIQAAGVAYRESYARNPDPISAAGLLRTWCKLPPQQKEWPRSTAEQPELAAHLAGKPSAALAVVSLAEAIHLLHQARHASSPAEEFRLCQECLNRLVSVQTATRATDPYSLRPIVLMTAGEACLAASQLVAVRTADEPTASPDRDTKFAWLKKALDATEGAERIVPAWCRQRLQLVRAGVFEEQAFHYKQLPKYQQACDLYEAIRTEPGGRGRAVAGWSHGRCELRWARDTWRFSRVADQRTSHLLTAYSLLHGVSGWADRDDMEYSEAAEARFCLSQLLFEAAAQGPGSLGDAGEKTGAERGSLNDLAKAIPNMVPGSQLSNEFDARLAQLELAAQEARAASELARKNSGWRWVGYAQQAAEYQHFRLEYASKIQAGPRLPKGQNFAQFRANVEELLSVAAGSPLSLSVAQRRQLIELVTAAQASLTSTQPDQASRYEALFPEETDDSLFGRVLLNLSQPGAPPAAIFRRVEALILQMNAPPIVNLARGYCEKSKGDLLYGPFRSRVSDYVKSPDSSGVLTLKDDPKLRAIEHLYAGALRNFDRGSDARTTANLSEISGLNLKDIVDRRWPREIPFLEAEWLRRSIEESEPVRMSLYKLLTARIYLHREEWALSESQQPLAEEASAVAKELVACLKPLRFLEIYFSEYKLDDYQRQLLETCESRLAAH